MQQIICHLARILANMFLKQSNSGMNVHCNVMQVFFFYKNVYIRLSNVFSD